MSYNYANYGRHNSIGGNWHLPPPLGYPHLNQDQGPFNSTQLPHQQQQGLLPQQSPQLQLGLPQQQQQAAAAPGFRNPWFVSAAANNGANGPPLGLGGIAPSGSGSNRSIMMSQLPTKLQPGVPLLQQHQQHAKRMSFANQLPTTYEYEDQERQKANAPYIHPPTRVSNPFNHYYENQGISLELKDVSQDRRMSVAGDGTYYANSSMDPFGQRQEQEQQQHQQQHQQLHNYPGNAYYGLNMDNMDMSNATTTTNNNNNINNNHFPGHGRFAQAQAQGGPLARRSSVAVGAFQPAKYEPQTHYFNPVRHGRQGLVVQFQKYQQAMVDQQQVGSKRQIAPRMTKVSNLNSLRPRIHKQPKYRRCSVDSIHISPANALTIYLTETYSICQPKLFQYSKATNPKRVLTKPLEPKYNNGYDNEDSDYILHVNDVLGTQEGRKYIVLDLLGLGTFGQVVKCQNLANQSVCAVKVIKSKPAYMNQSLTEVRLLQFLNKNSDGKLFIRLLDTFMHKEHLCLVFEILASNLYELIKQNQFQGLNMKLVKLLTRQLLESVAQLKTFQMIHCDLKPENILLCQPDKPDIKVIDFGSACFSRQTIYSYIQSRFYRSPEVILGLPYTESIDMWSVGCIVGELFLGLPMFPGTSEYNQMWKIVDMLGFPPRHMIEVGRNSLHYFQKVPSTTPNGKPEYTIKSFDKYVQYLRSTGKGAQADAEKPNKEYFNQHSLKDIIMNYSMHQKKMTSSMIEKECSERLVLVDFLLKVLNLNPLKRLTPLEALKHPFVADVKFR
ncbi:dual specificity protein kinase yak1 [Scheffersomyces spartinae]|uniref:Dual specificity protein kinase yak1 n=1 Tax=Scheffersomyces spartinae TaxID=45513 RepID=A0A9P7V6W7_9ASCO|nr:dual specificity protein kinase yak1 [Scheffersomyces spartinae]KAG7192287.1 dual specificity protein kinase yak1 [Scheffersomyces spartinae]